MFYQHQYPLKKVLKVALSKQLFWKR